MRKFHLAHGTCSALCQRPWLSWAVSCWVSCCLFWLWSEDLRETSWTGSWNAQASYAEDGWKMQTSETKLKSKNGGRTSGHWKYGGEWKVYVWCNEGSVAVLVSFCILNLFMIEDHMCKLWRVGLFWWQWVCSRCLVRTNPFRRN